MVDYNGTLQDCCLYCFLRTSRAVLNRGDNGVGLNRDPTRHSPIKGGFDRVSIGFGYAGKGRHEFGVDLSMFMKICHEFVGLV